MGQALERLKKAMAQRTSSQGSSDHVPLLLVSWRSSSCKLTISPAYPFRNESLPT